MPPLLAVIPEIIGAIGGGLGALGLGEAAALPAEIGAGAALGEGALGAGALGAGLGEGAAISLPEILVEGGAGAGALGGPASAGFGAGDILAGAGAGLGGLTTADAALAGGADPLAGLAGGGASLEAGNVLGPLVGAAETPNQTVQSGFDAINAAAPQADTGQIQPTPVRALSYSGSAPTQGGAGGAAGIAGGDTGPSTLGPFGDNVPLPQARPPIPPDTDLAGVGGGGISDFISKLGGNAVKGLESPGNLLALGLAAPLLKQLISPAKIPQQQNLQNLQGTESQFAAQQNQLGTTLTNPLVTGQLPQGAEQAVSNAIQDAITQTKSRYANLGLSGSTAETDAIANIQNQGTAQRFAIAEQMAQTGLNATSQAANTFGLQDQVFTALMNAQVQQDTALQQSLARFAAAAAGGNQGVNIRLGSTTSA